MITRTTRLQLLAFALVALLGMSFVGVRYVGLDRLFLGGGYRVAAEFTDSGGIFVNAEVTYRGVAVGRVSDMRLTEDGVEVELTIDRDAPEIPADAAAAVANRSAVGEQYVDLRPVSADAPYLGDGSVIPVDRTSIPIPVEQLLQDVDSLVGSLDLDDLRTVVDELGVAFDGSGDDLARLIDNGNLLLTRAEESLPQTLQLITDGQTVLQTQADSADGDRGVGGEPAPAVGHPGQQRRRPARPAGQRAGRRRGPAAAGDRRRPRPRLADPRRRRAQRRHHPPAGWRRAAAGDLSPGGHRRVQRRPPRPRRHGARALRLRAERRRSAAVHERVRVHRFDPLPGGGGRPGHLRGGLRRGGRGGPRPLRRRGRVRVQHPRRAEHRRIGGRRGPGPAERYGRRRRARPRCSTVCWAPCSARRRSPRPPADPSGAGGPRAPVPARPARLP